MVGRNFIVKCSEKFSKLDAKKIRLKILYRYRKVVKVENIHSVMTSVTMWFTSNQNPFNFVVSQKSKPKSVYSMSKSI